MEINELESKYVIHIEKKDEHYLVYNYFGRLILQEKSLSAIKKFMDKYYDDMQNIKERKQNDGN